MLRHLAVILLAAAVIALPFVYRREDATSAWAEGDPVLTIISPHNEAIRYEFERGFSGWHRDKYGRPVRIDWRSIGGTTEIIRFLSSELVAATQSWWRQDGRPWPAGAGDAVVATRPPGRADLLEIHAAVRRVDDPRQISVNIDLFFGGGEYDHASAHRAGLTVEPWPGGLPRPLVFGPDGTELIPERLSGETCRTATLFGNTMSMFGIVYNVDRVRALGVKPPARWDDLADPVYFRALAVADPTKSGSIAKAFEMIVQQKMHDAAAASGFDDARIASFEARIAAHVRERGGAYRRGELPADVPPRYQAALEKGWADGILLIQRIGANARYFTDSASKVVIDVAAGDAAAGMAIDFYGRYQAEVSRGSDGRERMVFVTPVGGTSVSCDPISLLRGAPHRDTAVRFIEYLLSEDGQRLWTYRPSTPGGPERFALRRLPVRRDFYPSPDPAIQAAYELHSRFAADDLGDPSVDPYQVARRFTYHPRWTGAHFAVQREIIRVMCLDSGEDLRRAWRARWAGPGRHHEAWARLMDTLPTITVTNRRTGNTEEVPLTWRTAPDFNPETYDRLEYTRKWTTAFRAAFRAAERAAHSPS